MTDYCTKCGSVLKPTGKILPGRKMALNYFGFTYRDTDFDNKTGKPNLYSLIACPYKKWFNSHDAHYEKK